MSPRRYRHAFAKGVKHLKRDRGRHGDVKTNMCDGIKRVRVVLRKMVFLRNFAHLANEQSPAFLLDLHRMPLGEFRIHEPDAGVVGESELAAPGAETGFPDGLPAAGENQNL